MNSSDESFCMGMEIANNQGQIWCNLRLDRFMWNFFKKIFTEAVVKLFVPKCPWCGLPVDRWLDLCGKEK
jgi:hypothetical protein